MLNKASNHANIETLNKTSIYTKLEILILVSPLFHVAQCKKMSWTSSFSSSSKLFE